MYINVSRQAELLCMSRSSVYYHPAANDDYLITSRIDEIYTKTPFYGSRKIKEQLRRDGGSISRKKVQRLMRKIGIEAIYPKKRASIPHHGHKVYPYLLRDLQIRRINQVWGSDITYIRIHRGWLYLVAIIDWYSRYVISWELSTSLDVEFCLTALERALSQEKPEIFNTDQGSQFTSKEFAGLLLRNDIKISMDGRGRAIDNIFTERLWRTIKYEEVYLHDYENVFEAKERISAYMNFYNTERLHQSLGYATPAEIYYKRTKNMKEKESKFLLMPLVYGSGHQQKECANLKKSVKK